jgi:hypothetical protein
MRKNTQSAADDADAADESFDDGLEHISGDAQARRKVDGAADKASPSNATARPSSGGWCGAWRRWALASPWSPRLLGAHVSCRLKASAIFTPVPPARDDGNNQRGMLTS